MSKRSKQKPVARRASPLADGQTHSIANFAVQQSWHGPLPSPATLAEFDRVMPGTAERIICMAEAEGEHTREVEMRTVKANVRALHAGQVFAVIIALTAMYVGYKLAMADHEWVAGVLLGGTIVALVGAFLRGKKAKPS